MVWFRRDLRLRDNPALRAALDGHDRVVPAFCFDERLLGGRHASGPRTQFLLECLEELRAGIAERGGRLFVRSGRPERELVALAREVGCDQVHFAYDVSPFARRRGERVARALREAGIEPVAHEGLNAVDVRQIRTQGGKPYTVFSPFHRNWLGIDRRATQQAPREIPVPSGPAAGRLPKLARPRAGAGGLRAGARGRVRRPRRAWMPSSPATSGATRTTTTRSAPTAPRGCRPTCTSAASPRGRSRSGCRAGRGPRPSAASSAGATSTTTSSFTFPGTPARSSRTATAATSAGAARSARSTPGARVGPASPWWTRGCASSAARAGCTTARAWSWAPS